MSKGKVLVIEDQIEWQSYLKEIIEDAGFYVEIVGDLESALVKIKKEMYHCITVDMRLSDVDDSLKLEGWNVLELVKNLRIDDRTSIIVITGFPKDYNNLHKLKSINDLYMIDKGEFRSKLFIDILIREVNRFQLLKYIDGS